MDPPQPMDAHLSATMEDTPEPEGNDIRRVPAGHLVRSGGVIVRAGTHLGEVALAVEEDVALGPVDVRLLGAPAGAADLDGVADAVEEAGLRRLRRAAPLAHRRDAAAGGQRRIVAQKACLPDGHVSCPGGQHTGSAPGPATPPIGYTGRPPSVEGRTCDRLPQALATVGPHG